MLVNVRTIRTFQFQSVSFLMTNTAEDLFNEEHICLLHEFGTN